MVADAIEDGIVRTKVQVVSKNLAAAVPMCNRHRGCTHVFIVIELLMKSNRFVMRMGYGSGLLRRADISAGGSAETVTQMHTLHSFWRKSFLQQAPAVTTIRRESLSYCCQAFGSEIVR
jgi:hypothetical protein